MISVPNPRSVPITAAANRTSMILRSRRARMVVDIRAILEVGEGRVPGSRRAGPSQIVRVRAPRSRCYAAPAVRTPIALYLLALVARLAVIGHFPDPSYPDSYYYVDVARAIAAGHGFNVNFIWIFAEVGGHIPAAPILPI